MTDLGVPDRLGVESEVDVGGQHRTALPHPLGHPRGDGARARADLEAAPARPDAGGFERADGRRVAPSRQDAESLVLPARGLVIRGDLVHRVAAGQVDLGHATTSRSAATGSPDT